MKHKQLDNCGLACPQPVINTKKALDEIETGVIVSVVDNQVAKENVTRFAQNTGCQVTVDEQGGKYIITITKGEASAETPVKAAPVAAQPTQGAIYSITTDALGQGPPELGFVLMKSFMLTLKELDPAPQTLIFMNTGAKLACKGSSVLEHLQAIEQKGTQILVCGTCLDFFGVKEDVQVGKVSNMFEIVGAMQAGKVITIA